jgi:hypothetical protein
LLVTCPPIAGTAIRSLLIFQIPDHEEIRLKFSDMAVTVATPLFLFEFNVRILRPRFLSSVKLLNYESKFIISS